MLPERMTELLTAYIDGELSSRKKRGLQRLLRKSPEARAMLAQLQEDSKTLRLLPRARSDRDFAAQVVRTINDRRLNIPRRAVVAQRAGFPAWAGYAAAAAVLFVVFSGSYLFFASPRTPGVAKKAPPPTSSGINIAQNNSESIALPKPRDGEPKKTPEEVKTPEEPKKTPDPVKVVENPKPTPENPKPTPENPKPEPVDVLTRPAPNPKFEVFQEINPRDIVSLALWELDKEQNRKKVQAELEKNSAHRIEVFLKSSPKSLERIETAFKAQGVKLLVDQFAQTRMKAQSPTHYVLFVEDVTPEEMTKIFEAIGVEDKKAEAAKKEWSVRADVRARHDERGPRRASQAAGADPVKFGRRRRGRWASIFASRCRTTRQRRFRYAVRQGVPRPGAGKPAACR